MRSPSKKFLRVTTQRASLDSLGQRTLGALAATSAHFSAFGRQKTERRFQWEVPKRPTACRLWLLVMAATAGQALAAGIPKISPVEGSPDSWASSEFELMVSQQSQAKVQIAFRGAYTAFAVSHL